jgi:hypothetical protein
MAPTIELGGMDAVADKRESDRLVCKDIKHLRMRICSLLHEEDGTIYVTVQVVIVVAFDFDLQIFMHPAGKSKPLGEF